MIQFQSGLLLHLHPLSMPKPFSHLLITATFNKLWSSLEAGRSRFASPWMGSALLQHLCFPFWSFTWILRQFAFTPCNGKIYKSRNSIPWFWTINVLTLILHKSPPSCTIVRTLRLLSDRRLTTGFIFIFNKPRPLMIGGKSSNFMTRLSRSLWPFMITFQAYHVSSKIDEVTPITITIQMLKSPYILFMFLKQKPSLAITLSRSRNLDLSSWGRQEILRIKNH